MPSAVEFTVLLAVICFLVTAVEWTPGLPKKVTCYHYEDGSVYIEQILINDTVIRCAPTGDSYPECIGQSVPNLPTCQSNHPSQDQPPIALICLAIGILCSLLAMLLSAILRW
jgi:hypothetical protein